jgi:hypothetical protein
MPGALPCPNCGCGFSCHIFDDVYTEDRVATDYEIRSGSWAQVGGFSHWLEASSSGMILVDTAMPGDMTTLRVQCDAGINNTSDRARLVFLYTDDNTYWYAEISHNNTTGLLKLFQVSSGSPTQRGSTQNISDFGFSFDIAVIQVCVESGNVTVNAWSVEGNFAQIVYAASPTVAGTKCGFECVRSSHIHFDNLTIDRHATETPCTATCSDQEECEDACDACDCSPQEIGVVIDGVVDHSDGFSCSDYNATFSIGRSPTAFLQCIYTNFALGPRCDDSDFITYEFEFMDSGSGTVAAELRFYKVSGPTLIARFRNDDIGIGTPPGDCRDVVSVPLTLVEHNPECCDFTSATVEISSL